MGSSSITPKYIRDVVFENQLGVQVQVLVNFRSGATRIYTIQTGDLVNAAGEIEHSENDLVDPITKFTLTSPFTMYPIIVDLVGAAKKIEVRKYVIGEGNTLTQQEVGQ